MACLALVSLSQTASAKLMQHNFTVTSATGVSGTGSFTWDDATVVDTTNFANISASLTNSGLISFTMTLTGGIAGAGITYNKSDCTAGTAVLQNFPNFLTDLNVSCAKAGSSVSAYNPRVATFTVGAGSGDINFVTGITSAVPTNVPSLSQLALALLVSLLLASGLYWRKQR
jgi:hypothetical protein